jgi:hypothetical protein
VLARDQGVCAICRIDTRRIERTALIVSRMLTRTGRSYANHYEFNGYEAKKISDRILMAKGFNPSRALWEADHVLPVAEGGGGCGLDGYRTLCQRCHSRVTGELRARLYRRSKQTTTTDRVPATDGPTVNDESGNN